jgi:hypothetical protein
MQALWLGLDTHSFLVWLVSAPGLQLISIAHHRSSIMHSKAAAVAMGDIECPALISRKNDNYQSISFIKRSFPIITLH